jgi:uncharacterized protein (DUF1778 family)
MKNDEKIQAIVKEAAKILRDYPHLKYSEAITKAKEVLKDERKLHLEKRS